MPIFLTFADSACASLSSSCTRPSPDISSQLSPLCFLLLRGFSPKSFSVLVVKLKNEKKNYIVDMNKLGITSITNSITLNAFLLYKLGITFLLGGLFQIPLTPPSFHCTTSGEREAVQRVASEIWWVWQNQGGRCRRHLGAESERTELG